MVQHGAPLRLGSSPSSGLMSRMLVGLGHLETCSRPTRRQSRQNLLTSQNNLEAVKRMKDAERQTRCYRQTHSLTGLHDSLIHMYDTALLRVLSVTLTVGSHLVVCDKPTTNATRALQLL